eukprot:gene8710-biopygen598
MVCNDRRMAECSARQCETAWCPLKFAWAPWRFRCSPWGTTWSPMAVCMQPAGLHGEPCRDPGGSWWIMEVAWGTRGKSCRRGLDYYYYYYYYYY